MDIEVEDRATPFLDALEAQGPALLAKAAQEAAQKGAEWLQPRLPRVRTVPRSDQVEGLEQPPARDLVEVYHQEDGATIHVVTFYGAGRNPVLMGQLPSDKRDRPGMFVRRKGSDAFHRIRATKNGISLASLQNLGRKKAAKAEDQFYVNFGSAPRLAEWAKEHYQYQRYAVVVDDRQEIAPFFNPLEPRIREEISRRFSSSLAELAQQAAQGGPQNAL